MKKQKITKAQKDQIEIVLSVTTLVNALSYATNEALNTGKKLDKVTEQHLDELMKVANKLEGHLCKFDDDELYRHDLISQVLQMVAKCLIWFDVDGIKDLGSRFKYWCEKNTKNLIK